MRIAVNTQLLLKGKLEGIGRFAHETLMRIVKNHPEHEFIFIFDRKWDNSFIYGDNVIPVKTCLPSRHPILWWWHYEIDTPRILKKYKADLFFSPDGWMPLKTKVPIVTTIHDVNFMHRPMDLPFWVRKYFCSFFPRFAQVADKIVTVSDFSKKDIIESLNISSNKIHVAYNGCNPSFQPLTNDVKIEIKKIFSDGKPYFVYVGSINPRKNLKGLLTAFDEFKKTDNDDYKLLVVGKPMWESSYLSETLKSMKFKNDVNFIGRVSSEVLQLVMASASALVLVSFFEGFGIPVVEAMYCDVPVICSNTTSLPEVAGNAAIFVNPDSITDIAGAMGKIAKYPELSMSLIIEGRKQRQKYRWDSTASEVWNVIEEELCQKG